MLVVVLLVLGPPVGAGQDTRGTAVIRGRVIAGDTGLPLLGASVQLLSGTTVRSGAAPRHRTDARGAFEIANLPAGAYRLIASPPEDKPMYLTTDRAHQGDTAVFDLADDEVRRDLVFALPRAGAISGRIFDQFGQPIAGADVHVFARGTGGRLLSVPRAFSATASDDFGRYRTWGFAAGGYYVRVEPIPGQRATSSHEGYVRTYYPNATSLSDATAVRLETSVDLDHVDVQLDLIRVFQLSGTVFDPRGRPAEQAEVRLTFVGERAAGTGQRQTTGADGRFTFSGLVPAEYELRASQMPPQAGRIYSTNLILVARPVRVTLVSADADNVALTLQFGGELAGTIATADGGAPPFDLGAVRVRALAAEPTDSALVPHTPATFDARSRFRLSGVFAPALLRLQGLPEAWFLSAVVQAGENLIDTPIDGLGSASTLRLVVSDRGGALAGTVEDAGGRPAALNDVRLFPDIADGPEPWASGLRQALTDRQGRFHLEGLAPGAYLVLAADRRIPSPLDEDTWAVVRRLATPVSLGAHGRESVTLTLAAWPY